MLHFFKDTKTLFPDSVVFCIRVHLELWPSSLTLGILGDPKNTYVHNTLRKTIFSVLRYTDAINKNSQFVTLYFLTLFNPSFYYVILLYMCTKESWYVRLCFLKCLLNQEYLRE
jgi:hypothetical protein